MKLLATFPLTLWGIAFTSIYAHPTPPPDGSDPSEIIYTERIIPGKQESYPLFTTPPLPPKPEEKIQYDLSAMLNGFVLCQTSDASPDADDAIHAIQGIRASLYRPARQNRIEPPYCTEVGSSGSAVVAICGPPGIWMYSKDAGKMANHIYKYCRVEHGDKVRLGGQYVFNNNTEPKSLMQVYNIRDHLPKTELGRQ